MGERLRNGEFYAEGAKIFRAPVWTANDGGGNTVSIGFHACTVTEWCDPASVVSCLNASRSHDALVKALRPFIEALPGHEHAKLIDKRYGDFNPIQATVTKAQMQAAREALAKVQS